MSRLSAAALLLFATLITPLPIAADQLEADKNKKDAKPAADST